MENVLQYNATKHGLEQLFYNDADLGQVARTVVMWYLKKKFGANEQRKAEALQEATDWIGLTDQTIITDLQNEIDLIGYNEADEHGIADEVVKVANLMLKYQDRLLKGKKDDILTRIFKGSF